MPIRYLSENITADRMPLIADAVSPNRFSH